MRTECPHCGQHYDLDESYLGQEVTCENCSTDFIVVEQDIPLVEPLPPPEPMEQFEQPEPPVSEDGEFRCPFCGGELAAGAMKCRHCGEWLARSAVPKNPVIYVILALTVGVFGVHNFYSGARNRGFIKILLSLGLPCVANFCVAVCFLVCSSSVMEVAATFAAIAGFIVILGILAAVIWNMREMINCHSECDKEEDVRLLPIIYILSAISLGWCGLHNFYSGAKRHGVMKLIVSLCFYPIMAVLIFVGNAIIKSQVEEIDSTWRGGDIYALERTLKEMNEISKAQEVFRWFIGIIAGLYILAIAVWIVVDIVKFCKECVVGNGKNSFES